MSQKGPTGRITRRDFMIQAVTAGAAASGAGDLERTPGLARTVKSRKGENVGQSYRHAFNLSVNDFSQNVSQ